MNELQLTIVPDGTPEQAQAMGLHYEIVSAAQAAAESLLALGRKLKEMRDTAGYKHLGFASFAEYTEAAVGIRQRQAYTYINLVEKVPARLIEENAAAGVTKLALLGTLAPAEQAEVAGGTDLANITVSELRQLIAERQDLGEQLCLLQAQQAETAEVEEIDLEAVRDAAKEEARAELAEEMQKIREEAAMDRKEQESANAAALRYKAEAARRAEDQQRLEGLLATQKDKAQQDIQKAKQQAEDRADRAIQEAYSKLEELQQHAKEESAAAAKTMAEMQTKTDRNSLRFSMLFEQLQSKAHDMMDLTDTMAADGKAEQADKLRRALAGALRALADQAAGEEV